MVKEHPGCPKAKHSFFSTLKALTTGIPYNIQGLKDVKHVTERAILPTKFAPLIDFTWQCILLAF